MPKKTPNFFSATATPAPPDSGAPLQEFLRFPEGEKPDTSVIIAWFQANLNKIKEDPKCCTAGTITRVREYTNNSTTPIQLRILAIIALILLAPKEDHSNNINLLKILALSPEYTSNIWSSLDYLRPTQQILSKFTEKMLVCSTYELASYFRDSPALQRYLTPQIAERILPLIKDELLRKKTQLDCLYCCFKAVMPHLKEEDKNKAVQLLESVADQCSGLFKQREIDTTYCTRASQVFAIAWSYYPPDKQNTIFQELLECSYKNSNDIHNRANHTLAMAKLRAIGPYLTDEIATKYYQEILVLVNSLDPQAKMAGKNAFVVILRHLDQQQIAPMLALFQNDYTNVDVLAAFLPYLPHDQAVTYLPRIQGLLSSNIQANKSGAKLLAVIGPRLTATDLNPYAAVEHLKLLSSSNGYEATQLGANALAAIWHLCDPAQQASYIELISHTASPVTKALLAEIDSLRAGRPPVARNPDEAGPPNPPARGDGKPCLVM
ncbi:MAG: hypothetical protein KAT71_00815 [Gammaproteobacteria bacterium]|nr:hypothetical protein [Gammaproteobacteria bacterium]